MVWKLRPNNPLSDSEFGSSVAIDGFHLVVGAKSFGAPFDEGGAAYAFDLLDDNFGTSVSIFGDFVVIGAPYYDIVDRDAGAAFVFDVATGLQLDVLLPHGDTPLFDYYGQSVSIDALHILVGANIDQSAYLFDALSFRRIATIKSSDVDSGGLGRSVALGQEVALVGSPFSDEAGDNSGSAYVFSRGPFNGEWSDLGNSLSGTPGAPSLEGDGDLVPGTAILLSFTGGLPNAPATLVFGLESIEAPFAGGVLVPSPEFSVALRLDGDGEFLLSGQLPPDLPPCVTMYFQCWIVDSGGPRGLAASNALSGMTP